MAEGEIVNRVLFGPEDLALTPPPTELPTAVAAHCARLHMRTPRHGRAALHAELAAEYGVDAALVVAAIRGRIPHDWFEGAPGGGGGKGRAVIAPPRPAAVQGQARARAREAAGTADGRRERVWESLQRSKRPAVSVEVPSVAEVNASRASTTSSVRVPLSLPNTAPTPVQLRRSARLKKQTAQTVGGAAHKKPAAANGPFVPTPSPSEAPSAREGSALSYVTYIRPSAPPEDECPAPQDMHPPVREDQSPAHQEQRHPFAVYLTELDLRRVIPIFADYGFMSSKDVKIWTEMVEQTRESLFQWLLKEGHVNVKELVVLHNDLVKGHPHNEHPAQGPTFATYLRELGLQHIVRIFSHYGFRTQKDVQVWREMSEETREVLFKWLMNDKLVNAKELVVLHQDLLTQQVDSSTPMVSDGTSTV